MWYVVSVSGGVGSTIVNQNFHLKFIKLHRHVSTQPVKGLRARARESYFDHNSRFTRSTQIGSFKFPNESGAQQNTIFGLIFIGISV